MTCERVTLMHAVGRVQEQLAAARDANATAPHNPRDWERLVVDRVLALVLASDAWTPADWEGLAADALSALECLVEQERTA